MKPFILSLLSLFSFVGLAHGQSYYSYSNKYNVVSSNVVITIQQPVTPLRNFRFVSIEVDTDTTTSFVLERNGTSATTTSVSYSPVNPNEVAGTAQVYNASNVGVGSVIGSYQLPSNTFKVVDISKVYIPLASASVYNNFTVRTGAAFTGNITITIVWQELTN